MLVALFSASCATPKQPRDPTLVGRWRATNQNQTAEYTFAPNGTFSGSVKAGVTTISDFTGKWLLTNGAIFYEYTGDTRGSIPAGTKDRDELLELTKDYFVIKAADGSERRYVRVAE